MSEQTSPTLTLERTFQVPVARLFHAFTNSRAIRAWWWPQGLHTDHVEIDFQVGGRYFINLKGQPSSAGGGGMTGQFKEIVENERIVMSDRFADAQGRAISAREAKMPGDWPALIEITFEFAPLDSSSSRFRLEQSGIPIEMQNDCKQGWSESFDKLERYVARP